MPGGLSSWQHGWARVARVLRGGKLLSWKKLLSNVLKAQKKDGKFINFARGEGSVSQASSWYARGNGEVWKKGWERDQEAATQLLTAPFGPTPSRTQLLHLAVQQPGSISWCPTWEGHAGQVLPRDLWVPKGYGGGSPPPHPKLNRIFCLYPLGQSVLSPTATSGLGLFHHLYWCLSALWPGSRKLQGDHFTPLGCSLLHPPSFGGEAKATWDLQDGFVLLAMCFVYSSCKPIHRDLRALSPLQPVTNSYGWEFKGFVIPPSVLQIWIHPWARAGVIKCQESWLRRALVLQLLGR